MANVVFMDGFDAYDFSKNLSTQPGFSSKWLTTESGNMQGAAGRFGGQSLLMVNSFYGPYTRTYFNDGLYLQSATIGFALFIDQVSYSGVNGRFINLMHGQGSQFAFAVSNIGEIQLYRGDTMVATSDPQVVNSQDWHYVEIEYVGHVSAGRATVYLDGTQILEFRGNTQAQAAYAFNGLQFSVYASQSGSTNYRIDDLYVIDAATRIGERRIETLRPNGDVAGNTFLPSTGSTSFNLLDDVLVTGDDYVSSSTVGAKDIYNLTNLSATPDAIDAIQLNVWGTKTDSGTRQLQTIVKSGSVETVSKNYSLPVNHKNMNRIENVDPATNAPWTPAGVNALQAGFKIVK